MLALNLSALGSGPVLSNATEEELENMPDWEEGDPAYQSLSQ